MYYINIYNTLRRTDMKKILIRSGMSPLDNFNAAHMLEKNSIGGNVGNLVYAYSIYRTLLTDDVEITPDYYKIEPGKAEEINETYDCYIIPLADAFRTDFVPQLRLYTELIKKLTIPVIVIGVGLRAPFEPKLDEGFPFDEDVKAFVSAVLEKSPTIGLRGEITSKYLSRLGFKEGSEHIVIGCPSMYTFGRELNIRDTEIDKESMICVNSSKLSPDNVLDFIGRGMDEFPNHYFIPQWRKEMHLVYAGFPTVGKDSDNYPVKMSDKVYMNDRVRYFLNVPTWLGFLQKADLSFGARLHGNVTATIAGTPSILIAKDARMRELAEYHSLTHVWGERIKEDTTLSELIEEVDFQSPVHIQGENFDNFINFLNMNNLNHIYKNTFKPDSVPLDEKLAEVDLHPPLKTVSGCTMEEMVSRWEAYTPVQKYEENLKGKDKTIKSQKATLAKRNETIRNQKDSLAEKNKMIKKHKGTLDRKSVRLALKTANMFKI